MFAFSACGDDDGGSPVATGGSGGDAGEASGGKSSGGKSSTGGTTNEAGAPSGDAGASSGDAGAPGGAGAPSGEGGSGGEAGAGEAGQGGDDVGGAGGGPSGAGGDGGTAGDAGLGGAGGDSGSPGPVACPSDPGELAEAFAEAVCQKRVDCCSDDYEECLKDVIEATDAIYVDLATAVDGETAELDCDNFELCVGAIAEAECSEWPAQVGQYGAIPVNEPACWQMVTPLVETGEACSYNYECVDGVCSESEGECVALAGEDESCEDAVCDLRTTFCNADEVCERRYENGEACSQDLECQSGVCDAEDGICVAPGSAECSYVPEAPASCSVVGVPGGARGTSALLLFAGVVGLAGARRFRRGARAQ
ncbi:MAG TPA: hypothetical protein VKY73_03665 [Polyangiaceae bacterium]|nr:hypothetical protein [Polyangiaceae bacterium]